jgi:hypothetical protein
LRAQGLMLRALLDEFENALISHDIVRYKEIEEMSERLPKYVDLYGHNVQFEALAQHHSLSTLLLDWSVSSYIALYFSYSGCHANQEKTCTLALEYRKI